MEVYSMLNVLTENTMQILQAVLAVLVADGHGR
jgi:hypothetical protein